MREHNLWKAVLTNTLDDLTYDGSNSIKLNHKKVAQRWFSLDNDDYISVCEMANIDYIRFYEQLVLPRVQA